MDWLELTVLTTTEGSELVSQILIDAGASGTVIEDKNDVALNQRPEGQWDIIDEEIARRMGDDVKVKAYYAMDARVKDTLAHIASALDDLRANAAGLPLGKLETLVSNVDDEDWAENWKKQYKPFRLGQHMVVKPGWETFDAQPDDKIIEIDPGMAFGTGTHETTGMCVELIEDYVKPGDTAIDIGTGTGILAIAAALAGAKDVLATDLDPVAVRVAAENVRINGLCGCDPHASGRSVAGRGRACERRDCEHHRGRDRHVGSARAGAYRGRRFVHLLGHRAGTLGFRD